jgi:hypothetical protein
VVEKNGRKNGRRKPTKTTRSENKIRKQVFVVTCVACLLTWIHWMPSFSTKVPRDAHVRQHTKLHRHLVFDSLPNIEDCTSHVL